MRKKSEVCARVSFTLNCCLLKRSNMMMTTSLKPHALMSHEETGTHTHTHTPFACNLNTTLLFWKAVWNHHSRDSHRVAKQEVLHHHFCIVQEKHLHIWIWLQLHTTTLLLLQLYVTHLHQLSAEFKIYSIYIYSFTSFSPNWLKRVQAQSINRPVYVLLEENHQRQDVWRSGDTVTTLKQHVRVFYSSYTTVIWQQLQVS